MAERGNEARRRRKAREEQRWSKGESRERRNEARRRKERKRKGSEAKVKRTRTRGLIRERGMKERNVRTTLKEKFPGETLTLPRENGEKNSSE